MDMKIFKNKSFLMRGLSTVIILAVLITLPGWSSDYIILIALLSYLYMSLGQMWNLLSGYAGLVSLGQQLFVGLGGYALAVTTNYFGLPIYLGLLIGGVVSAIMALVQSFLFFRMQGMYFAIATWVTAEAFIVLFGNWKYVGSGNGMFVKAAYGLDQVDIYYMALALAVCVFILVNLLLRSRVGLALMSMRDSYDASGTIGVNLFATKMATFMISGFVTGITGGLIYLQQVSIQPKSGFASAWTVAAVFIVVIGGIGTVAGPIAGAVIYVVLTQFLSAYYGFNLVILGVIAMAVILVAPKGIVGTLQNRYGFEILSPRRQIE